VRHVAEVIQQRVFPVLRTLARVGVQAFGWVNGASKGAEFVRIMAAVLVPLIVAYRAWIAVQAVINVLLSANPIGIVVLAIAALVAGIIFAYRHSETFRRIVQATWLGVRVVIGAVARWFTGTIVPSLHRAYDQLMAVVRFLVRVWRVEWTGASIVIRTVVGFIVSHWRTGMANIRAIINRVREIVAIFRAGFEAARAAVVDRVGAIIGFVRSIPGRIRAAVGNVGSVLYNAGRDLIIGLWNGIQAMGGWLFSRIAGFISDNIPGPVKRVLGIGSPSRVFAEFGRNTVQGFWHGVRSQAGRTAALMAAFAPRPGGRGAAVAAAASPASEESLARALARAVADALHGARLTIDDRSGTLANLYGRAG
jgi:hypothetical protein